jgi:D-beta-D-heptose 7-phosphate kinase/D-beta-D-heptose 1-phosphate adenosyltransferase
MAGGAANVACNLAQLGAQVTLIGICGDDLTAAELAKELNFYPTITYMPIKIPERPTSLKTRYRAAGQQILRVDDEITENIDQTTQQRLFDMTNEVIPKIHMLVLSDYAKGCLTHAMLRKLIDSAKANKKPVVADPKLFDFSSYSGVNFLTPNFKELSVAAGKQLNDLEEIGTAAKKLAKKSGIDTIITTLSARGILVSHADGTQHHDPARAREVFDVSGAGDTVVAVISAAIAAGAKIESAVSLANHAAGVAVAKSGTAVVSPGEILARMQPPKSLVDPMVLLKLCEEWRDKGIKIAFANGCFDILHPGHIKLIQQAAKAADRLIIGVNSDASAHRLKGEGRPFQSTDTRAAVLASLGIVDGIVVFDEDTPENIIKMLQPDFIVKGGDYEPNNVVGNDIVKARGGQVIIIPTHPGFSTSRLANVS